MLYDCVIIVKTGLKGELMARGRKSKPAATKIAEGNRGKRPINDATLTSEGKPDSDAPIAPPWLDGEMARLWEEYAPRLHKYGILSDLDGLAFERVVSLAARIVRYEQEIAVEEETYTADNGLKKANPKVAMLERAESALLRYLSEFGMTPASRSRISMNKEPIAESALSAILNMDS